jgi:hypothetical protein
MISGVPLRPEGHPGRFEVWDAPRDGRRAPKLEEVHKTAEAAMRAADALHAEWGSSFVAIDTWQGDHESQSFYRASCDHCGIEAHR